MTSSFTLEHPWFLLGLVPVLALAWVRLRAVPAALRVSSLKTARAAGTGPRARVWWLPDAIRLIAAGLLVVAMARPQQIDRELLSGEGIDIMIAVDMSGSMNAIDASEADIQKIQSKGSEPLNRFGTARKILKQFIRERKSDRIGIVIFGAEAYLRFPPTLDYVRLLNSLDSLVLDNGRRQSNTDKNCSNGCTIPGSGTAIGDALNRAYMRLEHSKAKSKMIILITDGKQEGGSMAGVTVPKYIASLPEKERVRIYTFQVGSGRDSRLPAVDPLRGTLLRDRFGRAQYQRPQRPFPTDPELLRQIAKLTGGKFYQSYDPKKFAKDFKDLERTTFKVKVHTNRKEMFFPWLLAGLILLGFEQLLRLTWLRTFPA
ncbi:MAG: VWA domain-containing protein [Myxococcales bacterium]|nr:VWA domain-containing protein [Myxococcales bacterium]